MRACRQGHLHIVQAMLPYVSPAAIDHKNCFSSTSLLLAAGNGHAAIVRLLLDTYPSIDVNAANTKGFTALMRAAGKGNAGIVKDLLACPTINVNAQNSYGGTCLSLAVDRGSVDCVRLILEFTNSLYGPVNISCVGEKGHTALTLAASQSFTDIVSLLVPRLSPMDVNHLTKTRRCALDFAASRDAPEIVSLLLKVRGVDPNLRNTRDMTPIMVAAELGHTRVLKLLLDAAVTASSDESLKVDINLQSSIDGNNALMYAVLGGHTEACQMLLAYGCDAMQWNLVSGDSVLHMAARKGFVNILDSLLLDLGEHGNKMRVNVHALNRFGTTALLAAVEAQSKQSVQILVAKGRLGPTTINQPNTYGVTPLTLACDLGLSEIVRILLENPDCDINALNWWKETPLICATKNGHLASLESREVEIADFLRAHGARK
eukprot:jgi/Hompol1/5319/HPOL_000763-RA